MTDTARNQIRHHVVIDEWSVFVDGKSYKVRRRVYVYGGRTDWSVEGGGNFRYHVCDPNGATHKRVVAWVKGTL